MVDSNMIKCSFGCGQEGIFYSKYSKNYRCARSSSSCPENKRKNSNKLKEVHKNKPTGWNIKSTGIMAGWQNKSKEEIKAIHQKATDTYLKRFKSGLIKSYNKGLPHTKETLAKISKARIQNLLDNGKDVSGKGKRGFYDGIFFHSSWELAFYCYNKEVLNIIYKKNTKIVLEYVYNDKIHRFIPDFIHPVTNEIYEIKAFLYSKKEEAKYEQYKNKIIFLFGDTLTRHIAYVKNKYGNNFTDVLYDGGMSKLVKEPDSKSGAEKLVSSSLTSPTK